MNQSQTNQILEALEAGYRITPLDALNRFGCFRLGARIYDLRRAGHAISKRMVKTASGKRIAEYSLGGKA